MRRLPLPPEAELDRYDPRRGMVSLRTLLRCYWLAYAPTPTTEGAP